MLRGLPLQYIISISRFLKEFFIFLIGRFQGIWGSVFSPIYIWRSPERSFQYRENSQTKKPPFSSNGRFVRWVFVDLFWQLKNILWYFQCISKITRLKMSDCQIFTLSKKASITGNVFFWEYLPTTFLTNVTCQNPNESGVRFPGIFCRSPPSLLPDVRPRTAAAVYSFSHCGCGLFFNRSDIIEFFGSCQNFTGKLYKLLTSHKMKVRRRFC